MARFAARDTHLERKSRPTAANPSRWRSSHRNSAPKSGGGTRIGGLAWPRLRSKRRDRQSHRSSAIVRRLSERRPQTGICSTSRASLRHSRYVANRCIWVSATRGDDRRGQSVRQQIVGTWTLVRCDVVAADGARRPLVTGNDPAGLYIFTADGHFSFQIAAKLSNFASNDRAKATAEESSAAQQGSLAYYGTYTVDESGRFINEHIERSSFPNLNGNDGRRMITTMSADQFEYTNPGRLAGGSINCAYKRGN